jgi:hypothetical protein
VEEPIVLRSEQCDTLNRRARPLIYDGRRRLELMPGSQDRRGKGIGDRMALIVGALVSCLGMVLLIVAVDFRDLVIYLLATAAAGGAYRLLFVGGLQVISMAAPERNRGGILSALYLLGYLSMGALALVLGAIATTRGLGFAVDLGAAAIILMNVATLVLAMITPLTMPHSASPPLST